MDKLIPAVIYAAKSTEDPRGSIGTQIADCRNGIEAEGGRRVIGEPFQDKAKSAFRANRGPGLAAAIAAAVTAADESGDAELWVQHTDRLARGSGERGEGRHFGFLFLEMKSLGVRIRSVEDDHNVEDAIRAVLVGERNYEDSRRKSEATAKGMRRAAEAGRPPGGKENPTGYRRAGKREDSRLEIVESGAATVRRIFDECAGGKSMTGIAKGLNADGIPSPTGKIWRQATISKIVRNPIYIGKRLYKPTGELFDGQWKGIVTDEAWGKVQELLAARPSKGKGRRPKGPHLLLNGMLVCGKCGEKMYPKERVYEDSGRFGGCSAGAISRREVDEAILTHFEREHFDLEGTRERILEGYDGRLKEVKARIEAAEQEAGKVAASRARVLRDYKEGEITANDWHELREEIDAEATAADAETERWHSRARELADQAGQIDAEKDLLEALARIRRAVSGEFRDAEGLDAVRAAIQRLFEGFVLHRDENRIQPIPRAQNWSISYDVEGVSPEPPDGWKAPREEPTGPKIPLDIAENKSDYGSGWL